MDYPAIPHESIEAGAALFTLVEPHRGHEVAYNRWYERDHFYAGCLIGPLWFAGRRWVATRPLKELRYPATTPFLPDIAAGSYLATYWILKGHEQEAITWGTTQVNWLHPAGRMFEHRDHVHTLMYVHRWALSRDTDGVPAALALDHPFGGLVAVMVDRRESTEPRAMSGWLREQCLPSLMAGTPWALTCALTPIPLPKDAPVFQPENPGVERRMLLMCFLDSDPRECWDTFAGLGDAVRDGGLGEVSYVAPFIPTIPGTDTYADQLW
ncbi:hypothetical protein [Rhabdothermincola sp.]|uniref:hypothetical protein n=1 Tax=Rhabdothermincola sp. TaxID=2820405 RepID=UPI002FE01DFE